MNTKTDQTSGPYTAGLLSPREARADALIIDSPNGVVSFTASAGLGEDWSDEDSIGQEKWQGLIDMEVSLGGESIKAFLTVELARDMIDALTRAVAIAEEIAGEMDASPS